MRKSQKTILLFCFLSTICLGYVQNAKAQTNPGDTPCNPDDPACVPIDSGISLLLAAGAAYGFKRYRKSQKHITKETFTCIL